VISKIHNEIGHFGEQRTLVEINKWYFKHNKTKDVKIVVCAYKQCQLVKKTRNVI
jgi:hypothetical protein